MEKQKCVHRMGHVDIWSKGDMIYPNDIEGIEKYTSDDGVFNTDNIVKTCRGCNSIIDVKEDHAIEIERDFDRLANQLEVVKQEAEKLQHYRDTTVGMLATDRPDLFKETMDFFRPNYPKMIARLESIFFTLEYKE